MPTSPRYNIAAYFIAITSVTLVLVFKLLIIAPLDGETPFLLFYGAIVISTWYGGLLPGAVSVILATLMAWYFFTPPYNSFYITGAEALFRLSLFLFEATIVVYFVHSLRKVREQDKEQEQSAKLIAQDTKDDALLLNMLQITAPLGMCFWDSELRYVRVNPVMASMSGLSAAAHIGKTVDEVMPNFRETVKSVLDTGKPILNQELSHIRHSLLGDSLEHFLISYYRVRDDDGRVFGVGALMLDITERKKIEEEKAQLIESLKRQRERLDFLVRASEILSSSLDYETTLRSIAEIAVPTIADWCAVDIMQTDQRVERLAVTHVDPKKVEWAYELNRKYPPKPEDPNGVYQIIRTGIPEFYPDIPDELLVATVKDPEILQIMRDLGLKSAMNIPLKARGRGLGMLQLVMAESGRRYTPEDFTLGQELANRAAIAVDNARLYREATQINNKSLE